MQTRNHRLKRYLRICAITVVVACSMGMLFAASQSSQRHLLAQSSPTHKVFLPFAQTPNESSTTSTSISVDKWETYVSKSGGYSVLVPSGWEITENAIGGAQFTPPSGSLQEKIWLEYLDYEMPETADMLEWISMYSDHKSAGGSVKGLSPVTLAVKASSGESKQIFYEMEPATLGHGYFISNGRLVLMITTVAIDEAHEEMLTKIANSVELTPDAPNSIAELYAPDAPTGPTTFEEYYQQIEAVEMVGRALGVRMETGETPTELLEPMPEWARQWYESKLVTDAHIVEENDRLRNLRQNPPPGIDVPLDQEQYLESERRYNEMLQDEQGLPEQDPQDSSSELEPVTSSSVDAINNVTNRRGLVARYKTPLRTYVLNLACGSTAHTGRNYYAIDIPMQAVGTSVYATTNELVVEFKNDGQWNLGRGNYVLTTATHSVHGSGSRTYIHEYQHLHQVNVQNVQVNTQLGPETIIGQVGNTGNTTGIHLHYVIYTAVNEYPVDLSPVKGLALNLNYPEENAICGANRNPDNTPVIIEADEFQYYWNPDYAPYYKWEASVHHANNHTGTAYRALTPITPQWGYAPIHSSTVLQTPTLVYTVWLPHSQSYRVWVCGMGGSADDDSVHMGSNYNIISTADDMTGWHTSNWVWRSVAMDNTQASLPINRGENSIQLYGRENSMRVDRIMLTTDFSYNPDSGNSTTDIRCGGEGLFD